MIFQGWRSPRPPSLRMCRVFSHRLLLEKQAQVGYWYRHFTDEKHPERFSYTSSEVQLRGEAGSR